MIKFLSVWLALAALIGAPTCAQAAGSSDGGTAGRGTLIGTTTTVSVSPNPASSGSQITVQAVVSPPTEGVVFIAVDGQVIANLTIANGTTSLCPDPTSTVNRAKAAAAKLPTAKAVASTANVKPQTACSLPYGTAAMAISAGTLTAGDHLVVASFESSDANYEGGESDPVTLTITAPAGNAALPPVPVSPTPVTRYEYDAEGNPTKTIVAPSTRAYATQHAYDSLGRRTSTIDAKNGQVTLGYDLLDQLSSVRDPRQLLTSYQPTGLGDVKQQISPDTGTANSTYDAAGNLKTRTDARGVLATFDYDPLNRPTQVVYSKSGSPSRTVGWTYDQTGASFGAGVGRLTTSASPDASTTFRYDALGRVKMTVQSAPAGTPLVVNYDYDDAGHITAITYPSGRVVNIGWSNGQPQAVTINNGGSTQLLLNQITQTAFGAIKSWTWQLGGTSRLHERAYDTNGRLVRLALGNLVRDIVYDDADRISSFTHYLSATAQAAPAYDQVFGYDELDRLITVTGATNWSYGYDANGNRTTAYAGSVQRVYTVQANSNKLDGLTNPARSMLYDAAGFTASDTQAGSAANYTATYSLEGRLASMAQGSSAGVDFGYDAMGRRISRGQWTGNPSAARAYTFYAYDQQHHLIGEYNADGSPITEYVWLGDTPVAVIKPDGTGVQVYAVHTDHLDTPRMLLDANGQVRWRWLGEPFGATPAEEQPTAGLAAVQQSLRFPGQQFETFGGRHYNHFRDYDPTVGRYVQSDPIGLDGGINTYAYASANPLSNADPRGLDWRCTNYGPVSRCVYVPPVVSPDIPNPTPPSTSWPGFKNPFDGMFSTPRPKDMSRLEERQFDRYCANAGDPCQELKNEARKAIAAAEPKMNNMLNDKTMFGTPGWQTHKNDLIGRLDNIMAIISLGQKMGCDMSTEIMLASTLYVPNVPLRLMKP